MENDQAVPCTSISTTNGMNENGHQNGEGTLEKGTKWILCISGKRKSGKGLFKSFKNEPKS
jgi:hypothetical protein